MRRIVLLSILSPMMIWAQDSGSGGYTYRYWFDNDAGKMQVINADSDKLQFDADVTGLTEGLHSINALVTDDKGCCSSALNRMFVRLHTPGVYTVVTQLDGQVFNSQTINTTGDKFINLDLDMSKVSNTFHTLSAAVITEDGAMSSSVNSMFLKLPTNAAFRESKFHYFIDDGILSGVSDFDFSTGITNVKLDVAALSQGFHTITGYMSNGDDINSNFRTSYFVKLPEMGGAIKEYRYWTNDDLENAEVVTLDDVSEKLSVIRMLEVPAVPFRSKLFACKPQSDGSLVLTAKNTINLLFLGKGDAILSNTSYYVDPNTTREEPAEAIEELSLAFNKKLSIERPATNAIKWYVCEATPGAYLTLSADRGCYINVFDCEGDEIYSASGIDATKQALVKIDRADKYYIAVHDFASYEDMVTLTYTLLTPYAIVNVSPNKIANKGVAFVDVFGNGFEKLKSVTIKSDEAEFAPSYLAIRDNNSATLRLDLDSCEIPVATYNMIAEFVDSITGATETVTLKNAITLSNPDKPVITTKIVASGKVSQPYDVYIDIYNDSNVPCAYVPLNLAVTAAKKARSITFKNFYPSNVSEEIFNSVFKKVAITDNLLGTGEKGFYFPTIIPYIGPHEKVCLTLGVTSSSGDVVRMYAWNGEPWSEEIKRLCSDDFEFADEDFEQTNMLGITKVVLMQLKAMMDTETATANGPSFAPPAPPHPTGNMCGWSGNTTGAVQSFARANSNANTATNLARAIGQTLAGIQLGLTLNNVQAYMEAYGIDPSEGDFTGLGEYADNLKRNMPNPGEIAATALGQGGRWGDVSDYMGLCPECNNPMPEPTDIISRQSCDPNDIIGYTSPSGSKHIGIDVKELGYTVEFENDPTQANAPAVSIEVTNRLDSRVFDLASMRPCELKISNKTIELPAENHFVRTVDMRPEINSVAQLTFDYDDKTGTAKWKIESLDPMSMEVTPYVVQGVLPVNDDSHRGEGHVIYTIGLKPGLDDGTEITNKASIVFDSNDPIETPVWTNVTDYERPEGMITALVVNDVTSRDFTIQGSDSGSGLWRYELYGMPPGSDKWRLLGDTSDAEYTYLSHSDLTGWRFVTLAIDNAGNRQENGFMSYSFGDVNMSGSVDSHDVVILTGYYIGLKVEMESRLADINGDSKVDAQDAVMAQAKYVDLGNRKLRQRKPVSK